MISSNGVIAEIAIDKTLYAYDILYSYKIPERFQDIIKVGSRVVVPFGRSNHKFIGVVMNIKDIELIDAKMKSIIKPVDDGIIISQEMLNLVKWLKINTFCTYFDAIKQVLPTGLSLNLTEKYIFKSVNDTSDFNCEELTLYNYLLHAGNKKEFEAGLDCSDVPDKQIVINSFIDKGILTAVDDVKRKIKDSTVKMVRLSEDYIENPNNYNLTSKQKNIIKFLENTLSAALNEVCYNCSVTSVVVKNMIKSGVLETFENEILESSFTGEATLDINDIILSEKQNEVYKGLNDLMTSDSPQCALLHGVTGSGKTSVFYKLINDCINNGKTAILLVPEISLTPQMVESFLKLFGSKIAVIHSNLSLGQRVSEYKRIESGLAQIVIGTRSAIFAPLSNIGIIIIDEEGEFTYKSERSPRYHARDVAKQRVIKHNALLLLASATPSLNSYFYAKCNKYKLFELTERYSQTSLPEVFIVDMNVETANGNISILSNTLAEEIDRNLINKEQSILLLNRRGYHTHTRCSSCGEIAMCPNCNISLTYHKVNNNISCHYCGYNKKLENICSKCGSNYINQWGTGTQRIEDILQTRFPNARILRMDADTTISKNAYTENFTEFGKGNYDIMIGTQMIAKGLDFSNVTLVGILETDKALYTGDYLGYERTFSLITQVVGRCGRGEKAGRAYLQTYTPEHYILNLAAKQDYIEFFNEEIEIRRTLLFPPFCDICTIGFSSVLEPICENAANEFVRILNKRVDMEEKRLPLRILGPTKSTLSKINGRFRYRIILKCKNNSNFRKLLNDVIINVSKSKLFANVSFFVDMNGDLY